MAKKSLDSCRTGQDLVRYARSNGLEIRNGKGSHVVVTKPDYGSMAIPVHGNQQLGRGILRAIVKWFIAAGLGLFVLAALAGI